MNRIDKGSEIDSMGELFAISISFDCKVLSLKFKIVENIEL